MNELPFIALLKRALPAQALPWVTIALRQDGLIWRCLQDSDFRARALARTQPGVDQAEAWSPAAIALLSLDLPYTPQRLSSDIHYPLESRLRRKVAAAARLWTATDAVALLGRAGRAQGEGVQDAPSTGEDELEQAGLLALALRERRRLVGSWDGLPQDFVRMRAKIDLPFSHWFTPLACLYGLIPDPLDLLFALLLPGASQDLHSLALHALLANPMPPEKTAEILQALLKRLLPVARVILLSRLAEARPVLAAEVAGYTLDHLWDTEEASFSQGVTPTGYHLPDPLEDLAALARQLHEAQAHRFAARPAQALPLLRAARETCLHLHAELTAGIALSAQRQEPVAALAAWEQAVSLAPENLVYRAGLILSLLEGGRTGEARQWLGAEDFEHFSDLSLAYAAARLAAATGDIDQARQIARAMLEKIKEPESGVSFPRAGFQLISPSAFPILLMELGLMEEAACAAQLALDVQPADAELLALVGQAWMGAGQPEAAIQALQIAVSLAPGQPGLRRQIAIALEAGGDWQAALEQRQAVVMARTGEFGPLSLQAFEAAPDSEMGADLRALAACALQANVPQQAMEACRKALELDDEDGSAHLFLGQSLVALGDPLSAQEHYLQATRLAPSLAEPWLALARLHQETGQGQRAMDTLRAAAQALPDSAEVHLALGEACLGENSAPEEQRAGSLPSPAQALAYFQRAATLAPGSVCIALRLGQTLHKLGHHLEARQTLERAYQAEPAYPGLAHAYALILASLGDTVGALPVLTLLAEDPAFSRDATLHLAYGRALMSVGQEFRKAVEAFRRVLGLDPGCVEAQASLAEALSAAGDLPASMQAFQAAMETDLVDEPAWQARLSLGLGRVALALGRNEIAVAALQEASQADPHDPAIARSLADACYTAGLPENALQAARTALRLAPDDLEILAWFAERVSHWIGSSGAEPGAENNLATAAVTAFRPVTEQTSLTPSAISLLRTEALNALARALQIAPRRADLLVRLGRVQLEAGDRSAALDTFREVAASPLASVRDLYAAARCLLEVGDAAGAVTCLEKAIPMAVISQSETESSVSKPEAIYPLDLQILLSAAFEKAGNVPAALSTLETAMADLPSDSRDLSLHRAKARLLKGLDRRVETLACLETAIQLAASAPVQDENCQGASSTPVDRGVHDLHYEAALLLRSAGDLPGALSHTNRILSSCDTADPSPFLLPAQVLAAELAHSMLLPERARSILGASEEGQAQAREASRLGATPHDFEYFCLRAELALEWNDEIQATESLARASDALSGSVRADGEGLEGGGASASPSYEILQARLLGIQARLNILHGDRNTALAMVQEATKVTLSAPEAHPGQSLASLPLAGLLSIGEAAFLLDQWETAVQCFQAAVESAPHEPISHLSLARVLVLRAETERLYRAVDAIRHAPGTASLGRPAYTAFERSIDAAHQQVSQWLTGDERLARPSRDEARNPEPLSASRQPAGGAPAIPMVANAPRTIARAMRTAPYRRSDMIQAQTLVSRWRARGQAVFQPGPQSAQALSATLAVLPPNPEDVAAQIAALRFSASREAEPTSASQDSTLVEPRNNRSTHNPPTSPLATAFGVASHSLGSRSNAAGFVPEQAIIAVQASRAYPQHPLVLAQLALILSTKEEHLPEALTAAREATSNTQPAADLWPVCNALVACLARDAGDQETARQAIRQALACWPGEPRWQALAAEINLALGDLEAAVAHLEEAARLETGYLPHFLALGRAYLQQALRAGKGGDPQPEASQESASAAGRDRAAFDRKLRESDPAPREVPEERPFRLAIHTLEEACRLSAGQPEPWLALAEAQCSGGFLDRAAESAGRAIDLAPGEHRPHMLRAEIALLAGDARAAYEHISAAMQLEGAASGPIGCQLSMLLARALDRLDRPAEALSVLEKALPRASQPLPLLLERIQLLRRIHGAQAATDALQQLASQFPTEPQVMGPLALALAEAGQEEAAIRAAQGALQAFAVNPSASEEWKTLSPEGEAAHPTALHALLGRLLRDAGQLDGAIHHLNEAIRLEPRILDPYLELGRALQERRQHAQALQVYSQATRIAPRDPRPYYQAGLALKESRDYLGAENMLRRASALAPNDLNIHRQLGAVVALNLVHNRTSARQNA